MDAFYFGYSNKNVKDFDFIMKLDADIILPNNYILEVSKRMNSNLQIGLCGGICLTKGCLLYTSPSPRDQRGSRMPCSG